MLESFPTPIIIGNKYGHDIRVRCAPLADGRSLFDNQPTEKDLNQAMLSEIVPGMHIFNGYQYPVQVLPSTNRLFFQQVDAIGNRNMLAKIYLLGRHFENFVGERISEDESWSIVRDSYGNIVFDEYGRVKKDAETCSFISISYTPFRPGNVSAGLVKNTKENKYRFDQIKALYVRVMADPIQVERMQAIEREAGLG